MQFQHPDHICQLSPPIAHTKTWLSIMQTLLVAL